MMRWKPFILIHSIALFLLATWLWPVTFVYWKMLDAAAFRFLNFSLEHSLMSQIFWAIANVRAADLIGAVFMVMFLLLYIFDGHQGQERRQRIANMIFICIWFEIGILFTKEVVDAFIQHYHFLRDSPTFVYSNSIMISEVAPWLKVKDISRSCFPGDHAEILIQWTIFVFAVCGRWYGLLAIGPALFFMLPRLIGGAHWLSDVLVGSLSIALSVLAWAMYSPLHSYSMRLAKWIATLLYPHKKAAQ